MKGLLKRLLRYVTIDTRSDDASTTFPSTPAQTAFGHILADELNAIGLSDVEVDEYGYVMATIPATEGCENAPVIGFLAHLDTSPDLSGADVRPRIIENYNGAEISLGTLTLSPLDFPELSRLVGHTLITTDGTTLLGADDKAGIAIIMTAAEYLLSHPEIPHGRIRIAFTPDEETGRGTDHFDVAKFGAQYAYTVDGGPEGELEYENFNAAAAHIEFTGRNFHPGYARGKMKNALYAAMRFDAMLPSGERPENTDGLNGFFHLTSLSGDVESATADYILRDFSREGIERRKRIVLDAATAVEAKADISDTYFNMREVIERHPEVVRRAERAMREIGIEPVVKPIRGGTDGARLSFMGLPCPNLFTGGANFHSVYEYCSLDSMSKAVHLLIAICTAAVREA